jgi:hypothetical protein
MTKLFSIPVLVVALCAMATPALAIDGSDNPGTEFQQEFQPEGTPDQTSNPGTEFQPEGTPTAEDNPGTEFHEGAPYSGDDNPGLTREEARAVAFEECNEWKANFAVNKQQFGQCVAAVAKSLRQPGVSAREACRATDLSREAAKGETRSDFKACVLAAREANEETSS